MGAITDLCLVVCFVCDCSSSIMSPRLSDADRYKILFFFNDLHLSLRLIASRVGCDVSTVVRTLERYRETGDVSDRPRTGRPSVMNPTSLRRLNRIIRSHPSSTSTSLVNQMTIATGRRISPRTIRRARAQTLGYHPAHEIITRTLTHSNKEARMKFASTHLNTNWHHVLFSDEKLFVLQNTGRVVWIKAGEPIPMREVGEQKASVMVWGCVWYGGKSTLHTTSKTITAQRYTDILSTHLLPIMPGGSRFRFRHDNATPHKAAHTHNWCAQFGVNVLPDWPPNSPDLNPTESIWAWMTRFVNSQAPTNRNQLKRAIRMAWQHLPQSTIQAYIDHLPTVCRQIIDAGGDHV